MALILPITSGELVVKPGERWCHALHVTKGEAWCPNRLLISEAATPGGAADWVVNELSWNRRSQLSAKDLSGALFGTIGAVNGLPTEARFVGDEMQPDDVGLIAVTYVGPLAAGAPFYASLVQT